MRERNGADPHPDALLSELAGRQHGVAARLQLLELGLSEDVIDRRIKSGHLHRLHSGVYAVGHQVLGREGRWMAAVLAGGPGAVLSHRSAGALWGLLTSHTIEITTPRSARSSRSIKRHTATLPPDEVTVRWGIPVTAAQRTLFDLAAVLRPDRLERVIREAEVLRLEDPLSLRDLMARHPRRRGAAALRACLDRVNEPSGGVTRNEFEQRFVAALEGAGLPRPQVNSPLQLDGRWMEVDCLWSQSRLIVELDGHAVHGTKHAFERDRERDRRLQASGWRVVRVTWRQLRDQREAVLRDLGGLLESEPGFDWACT